MNPGQTATPTPSRRILGLDGLRAIAILAVIVWHSQGSLGGPERLGALAPFVMSGWVGVDLFFALSGFLITTLLLVEERAHHRLDLRAFYARRARRILPAFYAVLLLDYFVFSKLWMCHSTLIGRAPAPLLAHLSFFTFWSNYYVHYVAPLQPGAALTALWSLCVEEHFYLLWPLTLVLLTGRRARLVLVAVTCACLPLLRYLVRAHELDTPMAVHFVSHYRMDSILWGAAGALAFPELADHPRARRLVLVAATAIAASLVAAGQLCIVPPPTPLGAALGYSALAAASMLLVVEAAATQSSTLVAALEWSPLRQIGEVSYGMYLLHLPMLDFARSLVFSVTDNATIYSALARLLVGVALTIGSAGLLQRLVERPFLRRGTTVTDAAEHCAPRAASP